MREPRIVDGETPSGGSEAMTSSPSTDDLFTSESKSGFAPSVHAFCITCENDFSFVSSKPHILARRGRRMSKSTCRVCLPAIAYEIATDDDVIVLPSPGCVDMKRRQWESAS